MISNNNNTRERFWSKVPTRGSDVCWEWCGSINYDGYGLFQHEGKSKKAHRMAWALTYGPIPDGLCVCHQCDNRGCVNLRHLFLGTPGDNIRDAISKERMPAGERHPNAKLSWAQVKLVRHLLAEGMTQPQLAKRFGVWQTNISHIKLFKQWKPRAL